MSVRTRTILLVLTLLSIPLGLLAADNDPMMGVFKLNIAKSKLAPNYSTNIIRHHVPVPGGITVIQERTAADGKQTKGEWTIMFDGKDYPITGDPNVATLSLKRVGRYKVNGIGKKDGHEITHFSWNISKDGKVLTYPNKRIYPPDKVSETIQILDRVE